MVGSSAASWTLVAAVEIGHTQHPLRDDSRSIAEAAMEWISIVTENALVASSAAMAFAAAFTCWRSGSMHPLNSRILRLFVSKDEVEDQLIRRSLGDQAALTSFRMVHGVRAETLEDARRTVLFAESRNLPLHLIGHSRESFDLKEMRLKSKIPGRLVIALASVALGCVLTLALLAAAGAGTSSLLVSLKATGNWIWISNDSAANFSFSRSEKIDRRACEVDGASSTRSVDRLSSEDVPIICEIWNDPGFEEHLAAEVPKQQRALLVLAGFLLWVALQNFLILRQLKSTRRLGLLISATEGVDENGHSAHPAT